MPDTKNNDADSAQDGLIRYIVIRDTWSAKDKTVKRIHETTNG